MRNLIVAVLGAGLLASACGSKSQKPTADSAVADTGAADPRKVDCSGACTFTATYTVSTDGFFAGTADKAVLAPPQAYQHVAYSYGDSGGSSPNAVMCAPAVPPCTDGGPPSACDVAQDLADPVVATALAQSTPPFFGEDTRGIDGNAFSFRRDDGRGFEEEDGSCVSAGCIPVPPAIARLKADLRKLDSALIASPECTALNVHLVTAGGGQTGS
jgi:hypothetical protein